MVLFKKYTSIKNFLHRYTIFKVGNLHVRLHKIKDNDKTTLYHNHPFKYYSLILKGGYNETYISNNSKFNVSHKRFSLIKRDNTIYHRINEIFGDTLTLFIAYGKYDWNAINTITSLKKDGVFEREIKGKNKWCKRENGIWFIGNSDKNIAKNETRHSIFQI